MPSSLGLTFYEKQHGDYIERYALSESQFYMESFYPKVLENNIGKRLKEILNYNYEHSLEKNPNSQQSDEDFVLIDDSENNNDED